MQGYTTLVTGNVYRTLPDILDDLGSLIVEIKFYSFGEQIQPLEGRNYRQFTTSTPYVETIISISNVVNIREICIKSFNEPSTFVLKFKREMTLGACPFEPSLKSKAKVFTPESDRYMATSDGKNF